MIFGSYKSRDQSHFDFHTLPYLGKLNHSILTKGFKNKTRIFEVGYESEVLKLIT